MFRLIVLKFISVRHILKNLQYTSLRQSKPIRPADARLCLSSLLQKVYLLDEFEPGTGSSIPLHRIMRRLTTSHFEHRLTTIINHLTLITRLLPNLIHRSMFSYRYIPNRKYITVRVKGRPRVLDLTEVEHLESACHLYGINNVTGAICSNVYCWAFKCPLRIG